MTFILGDCLEVFSDLPEDGLDAVVDDPPAGIGFMGRSWDKDRGGRSKWVAWLAERKAAQLRACKPGAYSLTWALPRTSHWTATALEDAGWRIRDVIVHVQGQGWPKGESQLKPAAEHWILAQKPFGRGLTARANVERYGVGLLGIDACRVTRGSRLLPRVLDRGISNEWGKLHNRGGAEETNLGSWPTNLVLSHCPECEEAGARRVRSNGQQLTGREVSAGMFGALKRESGHFGESDGTETIPAFICLAGCDGCGEGFLAPSGGDPSTCPSCGSEDTWWACPVAEVDAQSGLTFSSSRPRHNTAEAHNKTASCGRSAADWVTGGHDDEGGASRFFPTFHYSAKASTAERDAGCEHLLWRVNKRHPFGFERVNLEEWRSLDPTLRAQGNVHPTVKPLDLCEWLLNLVVPKLDGYTAKRKVGDGFCGSGSIPVRAWRMGMDFVATDISPEALEIARARLHYWQGGLHVQSKSERSSKSQKRVLSPPRRPQEPVEEQLKIPGT